MRGSVLAVLFTVVMIFVGIIVVVNFINAVTPDTTWSKSANDTWTNVQSYTWTAFGLIAIGIIVLGAVSIISAVSAFGVVGQ